MKEKPLNAIELGRSTWPLLHRLTLTYPEQDPTQEQKDKALVMIKAFSNIYPCRVCAEDFRQKIKEYPPRLDNREEFAKWMCEQHNLVNVKLGKPEFNCNIRRIQLIHGKPHRKSWGSLE